MYLFTMSLRSRINEQYLVYKGIVIHKINGDCFILLGNCIRAILSKAAKISKDEDSNQEICEIANFGIDGDNYYFDDKVEKHGKIGIQLSLGVVTTGFEPKIHPIKVVKVPPSMENNSSNPNSLKVGELCPDRALIILEKGESILLYNEYRQEYFEIVNWEGLRPAVIISRNIL